MKNLYLLITIILMLLFIWPDSSQAIPAFARKYGFNCNMCHTAYPKLNDFGQRYRDNGYQIPGEEGKEKTVFDIAPPIAFRTTTGLSVYDSKDRQTAGFNIFGLDLLAAGVMHKNISFLFIYTPRIDEPAADYRGYELQDSTGTTNNPAQLASLESVSLIFSNIIQDALSLRIGKYEPSYHLFSSKRSFYIFQPYEIYSFTTPVSYYLFDDNQIGIEATGHFKSGTKYGLGIVNGTGANPDHNMAKDIYGNLFQTFGKGDGQSAGQRIGVFGYYGWQPTNYPLGDPSPTGEFDGTGNKTFYRFGGSISLNWKTINLLTLYMMGSDDKAFNVADPTKNYEYSGGFAEVDYAGLFNNRLIASVLYNWISPPSYNSEAQLNAYSALLRYYLGGWTAVNISIHAEYTRREIGKDNPFKDNQFGLILDFDF